MFRKLGLEISEATGAAGTCLESLEDLVNKLSQGVLASETNNGLVFFFDLGTEAFIKSSEVFHGVQAVFETGVRNEVDEFGDGIFSGAQHVDPFITEENPETLGVWNSEAAIAVGAQVLGGSLLLFIVFLIGKETSGDTSNVGSAVKVTPTLEDNLVAGGLISKNYVFSFEESHSLERRHHLVLYMQIFIHLCRGCLTKFSFMFTCFILTFFGSASLYRTAHH